MAKTWVIGKTDDTRDMDDGPDLLNAEQLCELVRVAVYQIYRRSPDPFPQ